MTKIRKVIKSAKTGRFGSKKDLEKHPNEMYEQTTKITKKKPKGK